MSNSFDDCATGSGTVRSKPISPRSSRRHRRSSRNASNNRGSRRNEARYASRRTLGNVTLAREDARSVWIWPWLDSVRQDVAYAHSLAARNPGFSASVILVTSLGIGATTSVFGLVDGLVLKPLPVRDPDRLVYFESPAFSYPNFFRGARREAPTSSPVSSRGTSSRSTSIGPVRLEPAEVLMATGRLLLDARHSGRRSAARSPPRTIGSGGGPHGMVAVISYACWQRRFGGDRVDHRPDRAHRTSTVHDRGRRTAGILRRRSWARRRK